MSATVVVADDHPIVRQGLRSLLEKEPDLHVVGEAADGHEALALAEKLHPDILVADIGMPGMNGLEVAKRLHKTLPQTRIIILSMQSADAYVVEAFKNGAAAYVLKDSAPGELVRCLREVLGGGRYLSPSIACRLLPDGEVTTISDPFESLTSREREILQLTAEGLTSSQIGAKLFISPRTVELHRSHLMNKLGLRTLADVIRYALKRGRMQPGL